MQLEAHKAKDNEGSSNLDWHNDARCSSPPSGTRESSPLWRAIQGLPVAMAHWHIFGFYEGFAFIYKPDMRYESKIGLLASRNLFLNRAAGKIE